MRLNLQILLFIILNSSDLISQNINFIGDFQGRILKLNGFEGSNNELIYVISLKGFELYYKSKTIYRDIDSINNKTVLIVVKMNSDGDILLVQKINTIGSFINYIPQLEGENLFIIGTFGKGDLMVLDSLFVNNTINNSSDLIFINLNIESMKLINIRHYEMNIKNYALSDFKISKDNVYLTGYFEGKYFKLGNLSCIGDTIFESFTIFIVSIQKSDYNCNWLRSFGGSENEYSKNLLLTESGILISGDFVSYEFSLCLDSIFNTGFFHTTDIFLSKYSYDGDCKWILNSFSKENDNSNDMLNIDKENFIVSNTFFDKKINIGSINYETNLPTSTFISKFNTNGSLMNSTYLESDNYVTTSFIESNNTSKFWFGGECQGAFLSDGKKTYTLDNKFSNLYIGVMTNNLVLSYFSILSFDRPTYLGEIISGNNNKYYIDIITRSNLIKLNNKVIYLDSLYSEKHLILSLDDTLLDYASGNNSRENCTYIYPNPVIDEINFSIKYSNWSNYQIFNLNGTEVMSGKILNTKVNVNDLVSGVYFVKLKAPNKNTYLAKFLKY